MSANLPLQLARKVKYLLILAYLSWPKRVQCNVCGWEGRQFLSDPWHKYGLCPKCRTSFRQRLFFAALQHLDDLSFEKIFRGKAVLHFAPEQAVTAGIRERPARYVTADFLREDCDLKLDLCAMPQVKDGSYDVVIAFDVLEHVPDYHQALSEVHRILSPRGCAIFTVPQKDGLRETYEDASKVTPEERTRYFGQWDHLRIFGDDFPVVVERAGFSVTAVDESFFSEELNKKHVLFPLVLSNHPLATNYRKVFFCIKQR